MGTDSLSSSGASWMSDGPVLVVRWCWAQGFGVANERDGRQILMVVTVCEDEEFVCAQCCV